MPVKGASSRGFSRRIGRDWFGAIDDRVVFSAERAIGHGIIDEIAVLKPCVAHLIAAPDRRHYGPVNERPFREAVVAGLAPVSQFKASSPAVARTNGVKTMARSAHGSVFRSLTPGRPPFVNSTRATSSARLKATRVS